MKKAFTCRKSILVAFLSILMVCCSLLTSCEFLKGFFDRDAYWEWRINKMEFAASSQGEDYYILYQGKTISIAVETDKSLYEEVRYWSDDESIVSFVNGGDKEPYHQSEWQGVSLGSTKIYAEAVKSKVRAEITVTVVEAPIPPRTEFLGSGTEEDPYRIEEKQDLLLLKEKIYREYLLYQTATKGNYYRDRYFKLMADLTLNDNEWNRHIEYFGGFFDGNGKKISIGKTIVGGIFGMILAEAVVKNLYVEIRLLGSDSQFLQGGIAGKNIGLIENCKVSGTINFFADKNSESPENPTYYIGGIAGINYGNIINCMSDVDMSLYLYYNPVDESSAFYAGGLVGLEYDNVCSNSIFTGSIKTNRLADRDFIGSLIGATVDDKSELYYDLAKIDNRTDLTLDYYVPTDAIDSDKALIELGFSINHSNVGGVSDWSTVNFSEWDQELWDFSGGTPELRLFKK